MRLLLLSTCLLMACNNIKPPKPFGPVPTKQQLAWQQLEYYAFVHFNMNTFTGVEWGDGREHPEKFNPTQFDAEQWVRIFKAAGMKGVIITAKHHDGFCLWPSAYTEHSVKKSSWRGGNGDVLRELSEAAKKYGLKFGIYLSPWDRNAPEYGDSQRYNELYTNQIREVLTQYGEVFEFWFDGANGEGPNGKKQVYDWPAFHATVRKYAPNAVMFSDGGPDVRWIGNEAGYAGETNWSLLRGAEVYAGYPKYTELIEGHANGTHWIPGEVDVSIRPGWYYRSSEDEKVKSIEKLRQIYYESVGRNANLLLNIPVDTRGLVHPNDSTALMGLRAQLDQDFRENLATYATVIGDTAKKGRRFSGNNVLDTNFHSYWTTKNEAKTGWLELTFNDPTEVNTVLIQEYIALGQRVERFSVAAEVQGKWKTITTGTTIGYKRILKFPTIKATKLKITIEQSRACPLISTVQLFRTD
ncbi:MAG: alpha-L-fucosidase [Bacteroidetes Order II. Incertae sedis bacterium]|nr:alpha-L-fucosidase [Bacteroidetes Order II. bacterium]